MSSPASSKTPEHAPPAVNSLTTLRSFTLPARSASKSAPKPVSTNSSDGIETLFICSASKIVSFTATGTSRRLSPSRAARRQDSPSRSIAWRTPTERTLAVGVLRIYRVTASNVSFLNSGHLLHTIFPRSQCWCVDNQSVFVLRIRQDSYYRMELPYETEEDKDRISQFKAVLRQVLQYEKTQCPFARGFEVEEPERPKTPPRQRLKKQPTQKAKKWLFDKSWVPETGPRPSTPVLEGSDSGTTSSYEEDDRSSIHTESSEVVPESPETILDTPPPKPLPRRLSVAERASLFQGPRSFTAPVASERAPSASPMQRILESPPVEQKPNGPEKPIFERQVSDANSLVSSADSFYSIDTSTHPSPSPPFLDAEADLLNPWTESPQRKEDLSRGRSTHRRQISEVTVRALSADQVKPSAPSTPTIPFHPKTNSKLDAPPSSAPSTPPLVSDSDDDSLELPGLDVPTPPDAIRMKRLTGASQRRAFSPMPQAQNLFRPPKHNPGRDFTNALVRRTCELVLGPPAHLVSLMLRIAQSISNGFGFSTYRVRRTEKIPCSWESDDEPDWPEEDDFGIPLSNVGDSSHRRRTFSGELD
ncbi:inheritance of peroxisomes protein 1-domain-containing protein [Pyrenochaeta sp. MPI-SDFR-AT-0127]|nr:inheritance of peroxisomes protein 1-domain-containing protein [Pyrenochaeta sp. MPI-SDFR-AT-0127]